ncbi:MAG: hypothetical protein JSS86_24595 [Cyanobacteria bacterium SZAS LIN-2]|nr:hypothetical protein [Cyanobacteria bacterium SZAS LIN-2]MBS2010257.1 hypothetical protein [Cyanobacteria bacterium SZAS TMP-1]
MTIEHPYWDFYASLKNLRGAKAHNQTKDLIRKLAKDAGLSERDRMMIEIKMALPWFKVQMVEEAFFLKLREKYSYSVLSPEMLATVCGYSPLVEIGAGNGYNDWLLQQMGAEVIAFDAFPVEEGQNWFFATNQFGMPTTRGKSWTQILKGDSAVLKDYPEHTLLMVWPPKNPMALTSLSDYPGKKLVFIGHKKCCASSAFYKALEKDWKLEHSVETGSWDATHKEVLEVYSRP